jgi:hypothetical protein
MWAPVRKETNYSSAARPERYWATRGQAGCGDHWSQGANGKIVFVRHQNRQWLSNERYRIHLENTNATEADWGYCWCRFVFDRNRRDYRWGSRIIATGQTEHNKCQHTEKQDDPSDKR